MNIASRSVSLAFLLTSIILASCSTAPAVPPQDPGGSIFVATANQNSGSVVRIQRSEPWNPQTIANLSSHDAVVQVFNNLLYVVDPDEDEILVFRFNGQLIGSFDVGSDTDPRDIVVIAEDRAYVTRANATHLYRVDPQTGDGTEIIDLSIFADVDGIPEMERMIVVGSRLFIQLRRIVNPPANDPVNGALAVVDLETESLIDADPSTPKLDAIELIGPAPRLRMYVDPAEEFMLVSATDGNHLSLGGGIERINLQSLESEGLVLQEIELAALGGFVVTDGNHGYFLFHTDIIPSNHLNAFSVNKGAELGEILGDLGMYLDALLYDDSTELLYMPNSSGGLYVIDTQINQQIPGSPIEFAGAVVDQVVADAILGDVNRDGVVSLLDVQPFVELLSHGHYQVEADINVDGHVDLLDVAPFIALLSG